MGYEGRTRPFGTHVVAAARPPARLPPELAFLPVGAVHPAVLRGVADRARALAVSAETVLLAEGVLPPGRYFRLLAAHLGLPFAERPVRPAVAATVASVLATGVLPLGPNRFGWRALAAPTGPLLRALLEGDIPPALALTEPERLEALIRQARRAEVAHAASEGLPAWSGDLSARGGLSVAQAVACAAATAVLAGTACLWPMGCLELLTLLFSLAFLLSVSVRLAATAASPPTRGGAPRDLPDRDLPVYSVVVPLYREAREVRRLTAALDRLDYPVLGSKHTFA